MHFKQAGIYAALIAMLLIGFGLRVVDLETVPPGLFYDEASDGLDVWRVSRGEQFPIFFEGNGGREPLFNYLQALGVALWGAHIFSLRIIAVWAGVLTIAVTYQLARQLSIDRQRREFAGLIAAAVVTTLFWHLDFSRLGQRAILLPLFLSLFTFLLWRAHRRNGYREWFLAGLASVCAFIHTLPRVCSHSWY
jgi:4-amino-4-deoxy-L-arabinose transferase-like glycosyltransferase